MLNRGKAKRKKNDTKNNDNIKPRFSPYDCLEVDEFWTYVGKKKNAGLSQDLLFFEEAIQSLESI
jgi:hypothetical protein